MKSKKEEDGWKLAPILESKRVEEPNQRKEGFLHLNNLLKTQH